MGKGDYLGEFEQLCLLAVLRLGTDAYGVSIFQEIERRTGREPNIGAIYATLDRMEEEGVRVVLAGPGLDGKRRSTEALLQGSGSWVAGFGPFSPDA